MKRIYINSSKIEYVEDKVRAVYSISVCIGEKKKTEDLYFEVEKKYGEYLSYEVADPIVVMLLSYAMRDGYDFESQIPISTTLYYRLTSQLIPLICVHNNCYKTKIIADRKEYDWHPTEVATAMSLGVDSFDTYAEYSSKEIDEEFRITMLTFFENGAQHLDGKGTKDDQKEAFLGQKEQFERFCNKYNVKSIVIASNIPYLLDEIFWVDDFCNTHTYRNIGIALSLQKLFRLYYYSSGTPELGEINIYADPYTYEKALLPQLSTKHTSFIYSGDDKDRFGKIENIANFEPSFDNLVVCHDSGVKNCCKCYKCTRTMLELDIAGCLEKYKNAFDLEKYELIKEKTIEKVVKHKYKDHQYEIIYKKLVEKGYKIPKKIKIQAIKHKIARPFFRMIGK